MATDRWQRIQEVFEKAVQLPSGERGAFLAQECGDDRELLAEMRSLLQYDDQSSAEFITPSKKAAGRGKSEEGAVDPLIDRTVGQYRVIRQIGRGGMGVVYEAEQQNPRRTVALKLIRAGMASPSLLRRFEHEAHILGKLEHPGIATIFEAGVLQTAEGARPFYAMELIKGEPLTDYAKRLNLNTRQRLELIARIADAVQHAHHKGIIHRDLKPANILVTDSGQPKILDFGVARATDSDIQASTLQTDIGQLIGTVPYMSPEQVAGDPMEIDTRSDVYALGVVAYELLAGRLPYDLQNKMVHEAVRAIKEDDPTPLSSINRVFRGDIEIIIAKALEKDKARRYSNANDLAFDVRRFLNDEAIVARAPSSWYQFKKFAVRNKTVVSALTLVFCVLTVGIVGVSIALARAKQAHQAEVRERNRAVIAARQSAQSAFAENLAHGLAVDLINRIWDPKTGNEMAPKKNEDMVGSISVDQLRTSVSKDLLSETVLLWDAETGEQIAVLTMASGGCEGTTSASFSSDGERLLTIAPGWRIIDLPGSAKIWNVATGAEIATIYGNPYQAAFTRDGKRLIKTEFDGAGVAMWDAGTGKPIAQIGGHEVVVGASFADRGARVLTTFWSHDFEECVRVRDLATGKTISILHTGVLELKSAAISSDGRRVVTVSEDVGASLEAGAKVARIWDAETAEEIAVLSAGQQGINSLSLTPDGRHVLVVSEDGIATLWDAATGDEVALVFGHETRARSAALNRDATQGVIVSFEGNARVWDTRTGLAPVVLELPSCAPGQTCVQEAGADWIMGAVVSPDGVHVATSSPDNNVRIWSGKTGKELAVFRGHEEGITSIAFSPEGRRIVTASADRTARIWDAATGAEGAILRGHEAEVLSAEFSQDGNRILTVSNDNSARVWNAETGTELARLSGRQFQVRFGSFSPDGTHVAAIYEGGRVEVADAVTGKGIGVINSDDSAVQTALLSPDNSQVVTLSSDGTTRVWDVEGQEIVALQGPTCFASFNSDGATLITASPEGRAQLWEAKTGKPIAALPADHCSISFNPDATRMATVDNGEFVRVWDAATGTQVAVFRGDEQGLIGSARFSLDGSRLLAIWDDNTACVWNAKTGEKIAVLRGSASRVRPYAFNADATRALIVSVDNTVRVWDVATRTELLVLEGPKNGVNSVSFSPDGTRVLALCGDGWRFRDSALWRGPLEELNQGGLRN